VIVSQCVQALGNIVFGKPSDFSGGGFGPQCFHSIGTDELHGARAIFAYVGNQPKRIARRNLKALCPVF